VILLWNPKSPKEESEESCFPRLLQYCSLGERVGEVRPVMFIFCDCWLVLVRPVSHTPSCRTEWSMSRLGAN